jgi:hypothetical protein
MRLKPRPENELLYHKEAAQASERSYRADQTIAAIEGEHSEHSLAPNKKAA